MDILTAEEMGQADRRSVELGVPIADLMERAGTAVARFCQRRFYSPKRPSVVVALCGKGNNGGDGSVAALRLLEVGRTVRIALLGEAAAMQGEAAAALASAQAAGVEVREIADEKALRDVLQDADLVLDAVVGTGFKPPLRGLAAIARDVLAGSKAQIVAVDLPSGWDADAMTQNASGTEDTSTAFRADAVVTFTAPKLAHIFGHLTSGETFGPVVVAPIGTPAEAVVSETGLYWAGSAIDLVQKPRDINSNKGKFGHVLIVGGALGKAGAPSMASLAAMRSGAGLTTAAVPREILPTVAAVAPELMLTPLEEDSAGGLDLSVLESEKLEKLLKGMTVVGIGPGLGQEGSTPEFVRKFVERVSLPMVIDADALNALAGHTDLLKAAAAAKNKNGKPRTLVLTPHPGEMARLLNSTVKDVEADRIGHARRFATEYGITLVLKGWRTLIAHPDGSIGVNTTGNPAMAKGGSGDVLTGIVAAMLAQYPDDVPRAVEAAVFLHGLAGDRAACFRDEHTILATDTIEHLGGAFWSSIADHGGNTWICSAGCKRGPGVR